MRIAGHASAAIESFDNLDLFKAALNTFKTDLEEVQDEEEEAYENLPYSLQEKRQDQYDAFCTNVDIAMDTLDVLCNASVDSYASAEVNDAFSDIADALNDAQD